MHYNKGMPLMRQKKGSSKESVSGILNKSEMGGFLNIPMIEVKMLIENLLF